MRVDSATSAWINAVVLNGGSVSRQRAMLVDDLIVGLKADGIWTKLDRLWLFAAENAKTALTDLVGLTLATAVSSPTFTIDKGYAGNGTSSYIDTGFNTSTSGVNFTLNTSHLAVWD